MLGYKRSLLFPMMIHWKDVSFSSWGTGKTTKVFRLDWSDKEFRTGEYPATNESLPMKDYFPALPEKYDAMLKNALFALPTRYYEEMHRQAIQAEAIWSSSFTGFDSNIRDLCYGPAFAHIQVMMELLSDCSYDPKTNYFQRGSERVLIQHLLLHKFWYGQIGRGNLHERAKIDALFRRQISMMENPDPFNPSCTPHFDLDDEQISLYWDIEEFLADMEDWKRDADEYHESRTPPVVEGPVNTTEDGDDGSHG